MSNRSQKILILSLSGIGNFLMQSPTWQTLKKAHPDWKITIWVTPRGTKELAENDASIDQILEAPIKNSLGGHLNMVKQLRQQHFDTGIMLFPGQLWKGAAYLMATTKKQVAHTYPFLRNDNSAFLLSDPIHFEKDIHDIQQNLNLLKTLVPSNSKLSTTNYKLEIPNKSKVEAENILRHYVISSGKKLIGIHAGSASAYGWKRWPLENFLSLGRQLIEKHNAHLLIFGGPEETALKKKLKQILADNATLIDTNLLTTAAIMKHCQLVIANDSGLMHLAAASGAPTLGLFGPTNEYQVGPHGPARHTIRAPRTKPVYNVNTNFNLGSKPHSTLLTLTPDQVYDKIARIAQL